MFVEQQEASADAGANEVTIDDLADVFDDAPKKDDKPANPRQENVKPEGEPAEELEGETEADGESEADDAALETEEADIEGEDSDAIEPDKGKRYTLADGTKVTFAELRDGYIRQKDYSKKTEELAMQRKANESEFQEIRQRQIGVLEALNQQLEAINPVNQLQIQLRNALEIGDTEAANEIRWQIQETKDFIEKNKRALAWEKNQDEISKQEARKQRIGGFSEKLKSSFPLVRTEEGQKKFSEISNAALKKVGFSDEEIRNLSNSIADGHRDWRDGILAYKAGKYDEMMAAKPKVATALRGKAIVPKAGSRVEQKSKLQSASEKLNRNPNDMDAFAELFA